MDSRKRRIKQHMKLALMLICEEVIDTVDEEMQKKANLDAKLDKRKK